MNSSVRAANLNRLSARVGAIQIFKMCADITFVVTALAMSVVWWCGWEQVTFAVTRSSLIDRLSAMTDARTTDAYGTSLVLSLKTSKGF